MCEMCLIEPNQVTGVQIDPVEFNNSNVDLVR